MVAFGNRYFRFYNRNVAEGVTSTGQYIIKYVGKKVNEKLKQVMGDDEERLVYIDTDSNYFDLSGFITAYEKSSGKKFDNDNDISKFIDKVSKKKIQPIIQEAIEEISEKLNVYKKTLNMARENISKKAIFIQKKKYVSYVKDDEGKLLDELKISVKGVEIVRTSTPQTIRDTLRDSVKLIVETNDEGKMKKFIKEYKEKFNSMDVEEISFPRGTKNLDSHTIKSGNCKGWFTDRENEGGRTIGCPIHIRAAIVYNFLLDKNKLGNKYPKIGNGDKIKFVYLKTPNIISSVNPLISSSLLVGNDSILQDINDNIIGFPQNGVLPKEFGLHSFIDYDVQFIKSFISPLQIICQVLGWDIEREENAVELF